MTITIGSFTFDNVFYDVDVDVLYLHVGDPSTAVDFDESPEGHALRFDAEGDLVGVTIVGAKSLIDREGEIKITLPEIVRVGSAAVAPCALRYSVHEIATASPQLRNRRHFCSRVSHKRWRVGGHRSSRGQSSRGHIPGEARSSRKNPNRYRRFAVEGLLRCELQRGRA
jgi:uncharacterized protein YuzE